MLEEQFYLFLPLLVWLLPERFQFRACLLIAALGPAFRAFAPVCHAPFLLPGSFEPLFAGVLLAWASIHFPKLFDSPKYRVFAIGMFSVGAACMGAIAVGKLKPGPFGVSIFTLFWGSFLWLVIAHLGSPLTAPLRWRPLRWIGTISYGVYLFHPMVNSFLFVQILGGLPSHTMGSAGFLISCAAFAVTIALSATSLFLVEQRLIAIGHRFRYGPATHEQ